MPQEVIQPTWPSKRQPPSTRVAFVVTPAASDPAKNADLYAFDSADFYFLYGQFGEAKKRYAPIYKEQCGKSEFGYRAWERLTTMANLEHDIPTSRGLAEAELTKTCAVTQEQVVRAKDIATRTVSGGYYIDAFAAYKEAGVTHLSVSPVGADPVKTIEQLRDLL